MLVIYNKNTQTRRPENRPPAVGPPAACVAKKVNKSKHSISHARIAAAQPYGFNFQQCSRNISIMQSYSCSLALVEHLLLFTFETVGINKKKNYICQAY